MGAVPRRLVKRWRDLLAGVLVGLVPFAAYYRLWLSGPRAEHLFGDTNGQYWPDLVFFYRAFTRFQLPLWNPFERGGVSMLSEPEAGVLYPLNWLLAAFGAVIGGMPFVMIEIKACLHLAIGGAALFAWLRRRGLGAGAAAVGGVVYELGPYTAGNAYFSLVWPQAWLPVLMLSADWLLEGGGVLAAMATAAATFLVVVAGSPPTAFYVALVAVPYVALRAALVARREGLRPWLARTRGPLLLAALLAALACYPSVRGTFEAMRASARAVRTFAYVSESPLPTREWLGVALRAASGGYVYVGLPSLMLAALGLARWRARAEALLFGALGLFGLLLMFGAATPVLGWFYDAVPPCRLFRICVRYVFLIQVSVSVLAAHGFAALSEIRPPALRRPSRTLRGRVLLAASLALPLAVTLALVVEAIRRAAGAPRLTEDLHWLLLGGAVTIGIAIVTALRPRFAPALGAVMALVVAVDLGAMAHRAGVQHQGRFDARSTVVSGEWVARMQAEADTDRIFGEFGLAWRPGPRLGLRDLRGYLVALIGQRMLDVYAQIEQSAAASRPVQRAVATALGPPVSRPLAQLRQERRRHRGHRASRGRRVRGRRTGTVCLLGAGGARRADGRGGPHRPREPRSPRGARSGRRGRGRRRPRTPHGPRAARGGQAREPYPVVDALHGRRSLGGLPGRQRDMVSRLAGPGRRPRGARIARERHHAGPRSARGQARRRGALPPRIRALSARAGAGRLAGDPWLGGGSCGATPPRSRRGLSAGAGLRPFIMR